MGAGTWSLVQKDSFFSIADKNRMEVGGEGTGGGAGRYKAVKIFYLENCHPSLTNLETSLGGKSLNK